MRTSGHRNDREFEPNSIGDNYQLHTLLADRLAGRVPGLEPPEHHWVAAATDKPPTLPGGAVIQRRCRLFNGHGSYVYPEGRPADIQPLDRARVLVLHPPLGRFGWTSGRTYEHMRATLTRDRELDPPEAAGLLARVEPARETDLMGINRS